MGMLRTRKAQNKYLKLIKQGYLSKGCGLCKDHAIKNFKYWKIVDNRFPYNRIAKVSHMIVPKRHTTENKLNTLEKKEFKSIKRDYLGKKYEYLFENISSKSIPKHHHLHLIIVRDRI